MNTTSRAVCILLLIAASATLGYGAPARRAPATQTVMRPPVDTSANEGRWLWEVAAQWPRLAHGESIVEIACSEEAGIAVTSKGCVFVSRDAGTHWELSNTAPRPTEDENAPGFRCCAAAGDTLLAGGYRLLIMSPDGGRTWTTGDISPLPDQHNNRKWTVRAICPDRYSPGDVMAVADTPELQEFQTVGTRRVQVSGHWADVPVTELRTVRKPLAIVMQSSDGGYNWSAQIQPNGLELGDVRALHYQRQGRSLMVGKHMNRVLLSGESTNATPLTFRDVWCSDNGGGTWLPITSPEALSRGYAGSYSAWIAAFGRSMWIGRPRNNNPVTLWRTADGGSSWREMPFPTESQAVNDMALVSASAGVMSVFRYLYHTMNADANDPQWVLDIMPVGWEAYAVEACKGGRYPFVAGARKGSKVAILGAIPPRRTVVRQPEVIMQGPVTTRNRPKPR